MLSSLSSNVHSPFISMFGLHQPVFGSLKFSVYLLLSSEQLHVDL